MWAPIGRHVEFTLAQEKAAKGSAKDSEEKEEAAKGSAKEGAKRARHRQACGLLSMWGAIGRHDKFSLASGLAKEKAAKGSAKEETKDSEDSEFEYAAQYAAP